MTGMTLEEIYSKWPYADEKNYFAYLSEMRSLLTNTENLLQNYTGRRPVVSPTAVQVRDDLLDMVSKLEKYRKVRIPKKLLAEAQRENQEVLDNLE